MREDDSNWFPRWEEELPPPEELPHTRNPHTITTTNNPQQHQHQQPQQPPPPSNPSSLPSSTDFADSGELGSGTAGEEPARTLKKPRLVWTPQLHKLFADAVTHLGIKNAVPKTIMQLMSVDGLTRENVASHLQKYRLYLKRMQGIATTNKEGIYEYDVFLSFRGEDSRTKFTSHLYTALQNAGIYVFKDDDEIQRGEQISVSLLKAIGLSRISIVVLSKNYANSRWCMLELETIMEMGRTKGLVVVPVFYEVDPSEVRHQTGKFGEAFEELKSGISDEVRKMNWERALLEVGGIAGVVVINSRNESDDIGKVVDCVTNLLDMSDLFIADHPVGVESRVQDVIQLLNIQQSEAPLMLGIWGMGGIGKTTICKAAYKKIRRDFEAKSFLLNVREVWEQDDGKVSLQQRVLSDIYKTKKIKIDTVESGKIILKERLSQKRILLVLDDVNKLDQLNALCGSRKWFGQGSRIIITTRDDDLLSRLKVDHVYRMKETDDNESLELFSWHAFKQPSPYEGFADLSRDVVNYSGGLPLALQVIGSFLLTRRRKTEWKSVLEKLKLIPNDEVLEKLRISFDGLSDDDMKEIFLDIAFFFIGMDLEDVTKVLKECGHYAEIGISVLVQQSLVTVDRKNKIGMHDLLRDMGKEIVRKKSTEGGKEPSRLWRYEDVQYLLSKDARTVDVKGLTLKMSRVDSTTCLKTKAFEKMDKLRLLQLAGVQLDGNYKYLSRDLKWLCWNGFPLKYTPADFHQGSLVAIDLKYSNLQRVWKKSLLLKELKILNLSHSHDLRQTPDFSFLPNLEKLILKDCPSLSSVSPKIGHLKKILLINLEDCTCLRELPRSIYKLESLKTLIVSGCTKIDKLEEDIEQMTSLTTLVADKTAIKKVPFAVARSKSIGYISLCGFKGFSRDVFPSIIQSWMSPTNNILYQVQTSAGTSSLDLLDEQNDSFYGILEELQNLQCLWLGCDSQAQLNQILASILDNLHTTSCEGLEAIQNTAQNSNIVASASIGCHSQVRSSSSTNSLTSLLIQMGMNCHATNILRENILQNLPPIGSGLLPGDNYPDWLTFNCNGSSVTFEVPQVDVRDLKAIICIVYFSSPYNITSGGLKVVLVINCTKNTIHLYKRDALLASFDEEEWQRLVSNTEPGDKVKFIVGFGNGFEVIKTTVYLIYDEPIDKKTNDCHEPNKNVIVSGDDENVWWSRFRSDKQRSLSDDDSSSEEVTEPITVPPLKVVRPEPVRRTRSSATMETKPSSGVINLDDSPPPNKKRSRTGGIRIEEPSPATPAPKKSKHAPSDKEKQVKKQHSPAPKSTPHKSTSSQPSRAQGPPSANPPPESARDESPIAHRTPPRQPTLTIQVSEETLAQYFSLADPLQMVSSPASSHLEKVDAALMGEIPIEKERIAELRASLLKLSDSLDIPSSGRELYQQMALQISDVSALYRLSKENHEHAVRDLQRLQELQTQKTSFLSTYQAVDKERQADIAKRNELKERSTRLNLELTRIQNEIKEVTPQVEQLDIKLEAHAERRLNLYVQATSLDGEISILSSQKAGLEKDLRSGRDGIAEANQTWDRLRLMLNQAKEEMEN